MAAKLLDKRPFLLFLRRLIGSSSWGYAVLMKEIYLVVYQLLLRTLGMKIAFLIRIIIRIGFGTTLRFKERVGKWERLLGHRVLCGGGWSGRG
jgi:hypothetical protein